MPVWRKRGRDSKKPASKKKVPGKRGSVVPSLSPEEMARRRKERTQETQALNARVRSWLLTHGYALPIRVVSSLFVRIPARVANPALIEKAGDNLWMVEASSGKLEYKVERLPDDRFTCSCPRWAKQRFVDCKHIIDVRCFESPADGPYKHARRERAPRISFPEGTPAELTRRQHAREKMRDRFPDIAEAICRTIPDGGTIVSRGKPPTPLRARVYILMMKVWTRCSYEDLVPFLRTDDHVRRLGLRGKICVKSLYNWLGFRDLVPAMKHVIPTSARPGRKLETTLLFDGSGRSMTPSGDWLEHKYGRQSKVRPISKFLKEHYGVGRYSGLIPYVEFSLKEGQGSADVVHLRTVGAAALDVFPNAKLWIADKAYGSKGNGFWCERNGIILMTRTKTNENRESRTWPETMRRVARLEKHRPRRFKIIYNQRSLAETQPSRSKRRTRNRSLQRRIADGSRPTIPGATDKTEEALTSLPQERLQQIVATQESAIGVAPMSEGYAIYARDNIYALIVLEELHDQEVSFVSGVFAFEPIPTIDLDDIPCNLDCGGQCGHRAA